MVDSAQSRDVSEEPSAHKPSRFRFKQDSSGKRSNPDRHGSNRQKEGDEERRKEDGDQTRESERSQRDERRKRRRHRSPVDDPSLYDDTYLPNAQSSKYADPDVAFRESLFDAMADDEGASFWEGVYGQPIHVYSNEKPGPDGELEKMTDEEYTTYVRARMYEKTHQHLIDERNRRAAAREKIQEEEAANRSARKRQRALDVDIEDSLRRGEERRRKRNAEKLWKDYLVKWDKLGSAGSVSCTTQSIPWPTDSSEVRDISQEEVTRFFRNGAVLSDSAAVDDALMKILKIERVRWHPDKMQQRLGKSVLSEESMASITAVFQIVDRLWGEIRSKP